MAISNTLSSPKTALTPPLPHSLELTLEIDRCHRTSQSKAALSLLKQKLRGNAELETEDQGNQAVEAHGTTEQ